MTRTKLADRQLPIYSTGEEIFNSVSHIVGAVFGVYALVACVVKAEQSHSGRSMASALVYGICTLLLFTMSGVYHGSVVVPIKKVLQIIDHCGVFLMFAGTYTPIMLCGLYRTRPIESNIMLSIVYLLTAVGITLKCIDIKSSHTVTLIMQIITGWMLLLVAVPLYRAIGFRDFALIFGGGLLYTVGAVLYQLGAKKKYFHSVFHIFVLAGCFVQFLAVKDLI